MESAMEKYQEAETTRFTLYLDLKQKLTISRLAFTLFVEKAIRNYGQQLYYSGGGMKAYPGWQEFVVNFIFPLNERTKQSILEIGKHEPLEDGILNRFLVYFDTWKAMHDAYLSGIFADRVLMTLMCESEFQNSLTPNLLLS